MGGSAQLTLGRRLAATGLQTSDLVDVVLAQIFFLTPLQVVCKKGSATISSH